MGPTVPEPQVFGPYETEQQTWTEPMPKDLRALHYAGRIRSGDPDHVARDAVLRYLESACAESGVDLGAFDRRILAWLADGEDSTTQVVIGLISRAYAAGREQGRAES